MGKINFLKAVLIILFIGAYTSLSAQKSSEKVTNEIIEALKTWNAAGKSANVDQSIALFDDSDNIMLIGSDKGEVNTGRDQVREWLTRIFGFASFSWQMDSICIDSNGNTAWVFVEGKMIVEFKQGGTKITPYRFSGILVKKKGEWKWRLFDGSIPRGE